MPDPRGLLLPISAIRANFPPMRRTIRSTILSAAVLAVCAACSAGSPSVKSPEDAEASAPRLKAEYQAWLDHYSAFRGRADAMIVDGNLLRNHPGGPRWRRSFAPGRP